MNEKKHELEIAYDKAINKIERNSARIQTSFPHVAIGLHGQYNNEKPYFWTSGFWTGLLNLAYRETNNEKLTVLIQENEDNLNLCFNEFIHLHHDVGFMFIPSTLYTYLTTNNEESRVRTLKAASLLASRYNPNGKFIRAWNEEVRENSKGLAIIDCMMNLPLLYWASKESTDPRFRHIAVNHTNTVLTSFLREDGTVPHIIEFDAETGETLGPIQGQGRGPDSRWSRGQSWALYGFAIGYRETGNDAYLEAAMYIADTYYALLPENKIPYWDFDSDEKDQWVTDSSSAAIAASGMLELSLISQDRAVSSRYKEMGIDILTHLTEEYADFSDTTEGILLGGTVSYPNRKHVNVPIIYGDFYYIEALGKLKGLKGFF